MISGRFARTERIRERDIFDSCYNAYDGKDGGEHLLMCKVPWRGGLFIETPEMWQGVWTHNACSGMYGWEPFMLPEDSQAHRHSLDLLFDVQREDGMLPEAAIPSEARQHYDAITADRYQANTGLQVVSDSGDLGVFYNDYQVHGDVFVDGHCMGLIMICEHALWTRDVSWTTGVFSKIAKAAEFICNRRRDDGLILVKSGGTVFEQCYGYTGYPSSTQIFAAAALMRAAEVGKLIGLEKPEWISVAEEIKSALYAKLYSPKGFFVSAMDQNGALHGHLDYFESFPNVFVGPLGIAGTKETMGIVGRIVQIPEVDMHTPICSCYPGRPGFDIHYSHGGPGYHMNGGAWMGWGGLDVWTHLMAGKNDRAGYLIDNLIEMQKHKTLMDRVEEFGRDRDGKTGTSGCGHPLRASAGGFGNILRGFFDLQVFADRIEYRPLLPKGTGRVETTIPARWGDLDVTFALDEDSEAFFKPSLVLKFADVESKKTVVAEGSDGA
ncbi:MAG: glucosidase family protein [Armatimonadota bacterium]